MNTARAIRAVLPILAASWLAGSEALAYTLRPQGNTNPNPIFWQITGTPCPPPIGTSSQGAGFACTQPQVNPTTQTLTINLHPAGANPAAALFPVVADEVTRAWTNAAPAVVNVAAVTSTNPANACAGMNGSFDVFFSNVQNQAPTCGGGGTVSLGGAFLIAPTVTVPSGEIIDVDLVFGGPFPWAPTATGVHYDLEAMFLHAVGHGLGLEHPTIGCASLFPGFVFNNNEPATLHPDDEAGLSALYPPAGPAAGYGFLTGIVQDSQGTGLGWMNVMAIESGSGRVISQALSNPPLNTPTPPPGYVVGSYRIDFIPEGTYTILAEPIDPTGAVPRLFDQGELSGGIWTALPNNNFFNFQTVGPLTATVASGQTTTLPAIVFSATPGAADIRSILRPSGVAPCCPNEAATVRAGTTQTVGVAGPSLPATGAPLAYSASQGITINGTGFGTLAGQPSIATSISMNACTTIPGCYNMEVRGAVPPRSIGCGRLEVRPEARIAVSAGIDFSLALMSDGTVWSWGSNLNGQLGNGVPALFGTLVLPAPGKVFGLRDVVAIEALDLGGAALREDGTVWEWGLLANSRMPVQTVGPGGSGVLTDVVALAGGGTHLLALRADGNVLAWGTNGLGELGDGTSNPSSAPVQVVGPGGTGVLSGVIAIAAGRRHSLALLDDGTVRAWGDNSSGQLGIGTSGAGSFSSLPVRPGAPGPGGTDELFDIISIAAGDQHSLALRVDGTVWSWGGNSDGQLGDGTTTDRAQGVQVHGRGVPFLTQIKAITAGRLHSAALASSGTVWAWGDGQFCQSGGGSLPLQVQGPGGLLNDVMAIDGGAGSVHTLVVRSDRTVWGFGNNDSGQLGTGGTGACFGSAVQSVLTLGGLLSGITSLYNGCRTSAISLAAGNKHALALMANGTVVAWGDNSFGQAGNGSIGGTVPTPATVVGSGGSGTLGRIIAVAAGDEHAFALRDDGQVFAWGRGINGELGDQQFTSSGTPVPVGSPGPLGAVKALAAGGGHSLAVTAGGGTFAWGTAIQGQLGVGFPPFATGAPQQVSIGARLKDLAAGGAHSLGLASNGTVWAWGANASGQLGDGSNNLAFTPIQVLQTTAPAVPLARVRAIAGGRDHSLALLDDGTVRAWGDNAAGQLGDGTTTPATLPVTVTGAAGLGTLLRVKAVDGGGAHTVALLADGKLWAWGDNSSGQLGNGTTTSFATPVHAGQIGSIGTVVTSTGGQAANVIAAGSASSHALGSVWSWGANDAGQLGDGTTTDSILPLAITLPAPASAPPLTISCPGPATVECGNDTSPASTGTATATSASGTVAVTFSDSSAPHCGNTETITRTWSAADGVDNVSCLQVIAVSDTTAPTLTLPDTASIECSAPGGTPSSQAPVQEWLSSVVASDDCGNATITNDAPAFLPLGSTTVTFTAVDPCANAISASSTASVVDSNPPDISVSLDPSTLWPPNHRMVDLAAGVTASDVCGTASVALTSLTSNEADNAPGGGDGNTTGDIQPGADDFHINLRAERDGSGSGRIYTAVYTATDDSGNAASMAGFAIVPHDQGGMVDPLEIMLEEMPGGTRVSWSLVPGALSYDVVRGVLDGIVETDVVINLGTVACIEEDSADESTLGWEDPQDPGPGQTFFYLVEYFDGVSSSYGSESAGKPRATGAGACQ